MEIEGVDALGLDRLDRLYLTTLSKNYQGGPAGINALAATINEDQQTLEDVVEPFLLKIGFIVAGAANDTRGFRTHRSKATIRRPGRAGHTSLDSTAPIGNTRFPEWSYRSRGSWCRIAYFTHAIEQ